ncbi:MAG: GTPase-associated protein 1, N-terminal domain type 2 [Solirubrobacteraceae bacterium]|nr:GTPase-associated protein 1, N-terminal domain type 2 [Solirubrobacteraceae bacterium]
MRLGQLWYGWAPRGVEGVNLRQVVAGSGRLGDPTNGVTQLALPWCGYTSRPACGWIERDGIGVAFRRTPTGQDAAGREGAFFVHALIWRAGGFPASLLGGLWEADVWVVEPPDDPPDKLAAIQTVEELGLGSTRALPDVAVRPALAAHLENVAAGRRSSIALATAEALAYAAAVAQLLPPRFGLPAFSTFEEPSREHEYDMIASLEAPPHFAPIGPDADPGPLWTGAAQLLLDARDGEDTASAVVAALSERAADLAQFAGELGQWASLETARTPEERSGRHGIALAASDQRLLARAIAQFGIAEIARGVADGHAIGGVLRHAAALGQERAVFAALEPEIARRAPGESLPILARVAAITADTAAVGRLAAGVGTAWQSRGALGDLDPRAVTKFLRLLVNAPANGVVDELLDSEDAAPLIATDEALPLAWRGRAAGAYPRLVGGDALTALLSTSADAARQFAGRVTESGLLTLEVVLDKTSAELGMRVIDFVGDGLGRERSSELVLPVARRLAPPARFPAIVRYAPAGARLDARWGDAILDAYTEHVLATRASSADLPRLDRAQLPSTEEERFVAWSGILRRLDAAKRSWLRDTELAAAVGVAAALADSSDRDAALEVIVDRAADLYRGDRQAWACAMDALALEGGEPLANLADRIARTALRGTRPLPRQFAYWAITWVADGLDGGSLSSRELRNTPPDQMWVRLGRADVDELTARLRARRRNSAGRRWLRHNRDRLAERYVD